MTNVNSRIKKGHGKKARISKPRNISNTDIDDDGINPDQEAKNETVDDDEENEDEDGGEIEETGESKIPKLFPLRLGFFTFIFLTFFTISVLVLNIIEILFPNFFTRVESQDIYQYFLDLVRTPIEKIPAVMVVYNFLVPVKNVEALYISTTMTLTFFTLSLLMMKNKVTRALFNAKWYKKAAAQVGIFFGLFIFYMQIIKMISLFLLNPQNQDIPVYILIIAASSWLFFQSYALFTGARKNGTKIEAIFSKRTGRSSYLFVNIAPFLVTLFVIVLSGFYLWFLRFSSQFLNDGEPFYQWERIITVVLLITVGLCLIPTLMAKADKDSRRKSYDNLVVIMTIFYMYPYILFNFTIYFFLNPKMMEKIKAQLGNGNGFDSSISILSQLGQILIWIELMVTFILLIVALRSVGKKTQYKFGKLNSYSFILFIYGSLTGQFAIRYLQVRELLSTIITQIGNVILNGQHLLVNIGVIIGLLISVLMFSSERFGLYFRVHETVSKQDRKRMEFILEFLKQEYIRRERPYLITSVYDDLVTMMNLDKLVIMKLIEKTQRRYQNLIIDGIKRRFVHFPEIEIQR
ncbi:MAG: hypothetical protein ACTSRA_20055 [Promethearchaeota archaeon]